MLEKRQINDLVYFYDPNIPVPHAFSTRLGGVSTGIYESLNLGQHLGDDPTHVRENYDRILGALDTSRENLMYQRQIHTDIVRHVDNSDLLGDIFHPDAPEGDALVTTASGMTLAVFMADCIPILLWDEKTAAVAAIHAGWRSTVLDIAGKAVEKLTQTAHSAPEYIRAAIGPGIGACCFETDKEVPTAINAVLMDEAKHCITEKKSDKAMVDLKETNRRLLINAGILPERITVSDACTACDPTLFWSHRKLSQNRGSLAAMICTK